MNYDARLSALEAATPDDFSFYDRDGRLLWRWEPDPRDSKNRQMGKYFQVTTELASEGDLRMWHAIHHVASPDRAVRNAAFLTALYSAHDPFRPKQEESEVDDGQF